jgi:hypothetical protein
VGARELGMAAVGGEVCPLSTLEPCWLGSFDPALARRVYAQAMRRSDDEQIALRALVDGVASTGQEGFDLGSGRVLV